MYETMVYSGLRIQQILRLVMRLRSVATVALAFWCFLHGGWRMVAAAGYAAGWQAGPDESARRPHGASLRQSGAGRQVFDDPARDEWQMPDRVIETLALAPGQAVADIGAGTGYFTVRLAKAAAPKVYAVDIEKSCRARPASGEKRGLETGRCRSSQRSGNLRNLWTRS